MLFFFSVFLEVSQIHPSEEELKYEMSVMVKGMSRWGVGGRVCSYCTKSKHRRLSHRKYAR